MAGGQVIPGAEEWSAEGSGEAGEVAVLVVHGLSGNPITTRPLGERLAADGRTVVVPRLPGHGTSPRDMRGTTYADWLATVEAALDDLATRCRAVVVGGLSMGGALTLDVASRRELAGIFTINAPIVTPSNPLLPLLPVLQHVVPFIPAKLAGIAEDDIKKPGVTERAYPLVAMKATYSLVRALPRVRAALPQVQAPALVVNSSVDHTVDPADADIIAAELGSVDVRRLVLEDSFHVATLDHDQELIGDTVAAFVDEVTSS